MTQVDLALKAIDDVNEFHNKVISGQIEVKHVEDSDKAIVTKYGDKTVITFLPSYLDPSEWDMRSPF